MGDLCALTEGSGHDWKGRAEDQDGHAAADDLRTRRKKLHTSQKKEGNAEKKHLFISFCLPPPTDAHRPQVACAPPPPPLHVKLVPGIVRLVGLKLLITASRPPSSFQALFFHWRRHGCLTRPRHSPNSLPSEEVPRRERQERTSFTHTRLTLSLLPPTATLPPAPALPVMQARKGGLRRRCSNYTNKYWTEPQGGNTSERQRAGGGGGRRGKGGSDPPPPVLTCVLPSSWSCRPSWA